ncbi:hypothetical protein Trydic_g12067 [Trypoxylus dichotomus]
MVRLSLVGVFWNDSSSYNVEKYFKFCLSKNRRKYIEALKTVLCNAPLGTKNQQVKDSALALTLRVLLAIKASQIESAVQSLEVELIDVLMKYVYKGFESPSEGSSGHLLVWHEKAYNVGGVGCIVRVLSDTKRA